MVWMQTVNSLMSQSDENGESNFDEDIQSSVQAAAAQRFNEGRKVRAQYR